MERMWNTILTRALWILLASSNTFMLTKRRLCSTKKERSCALSKTLIISKHQLFHPKRDTQNLAEIHSIGLQKLWLPFIIYHLAVCDQYVFPIVLNHLWFVIGSTIICWAQLIWPLTGLRWSWSDPGTTKPSDAFANRLWFYRKLLWFSGLWWVPICFSHVNFGWMVARSLWYVWSPLVS